MKLLTVLDIICLILLVVGGVNWGLVGFFNFDLVAFLFGTMTTLSRVVYGLVGLSALYTIYFLVKLVRFRTI